MKLSCLQENLNRALTIAGRAVTLKPSLPVISNVLVQAENNKIQLSATNLKFTLTAWIDANVEETGVVAVPAKLLSDFIGSLPSDRVSIETVKSGSGQSVKIQAGKFDARIATVDASDFPPIVDIEQGGPVDIQIKEVDLKRIITRTVFAAAADNGRPALTGVNIVFEGNSITMAAADGFRLAVDKCSLSVSVPSRVSVIVPADTLAEVNKLLSDTQDLVSISVNRNNSQIGFRVQSIRLVSQLLQDVFPNYSGLIPSSHNTKVVVNADSLLRAAKTSAVFARGSVGTVKIQLSAGRIVMSAEGEIGDNVVEVEAQVEGADNRIAFNAKYVVEGLTVVGKHNVVIEMQSGSSPCLFRIADDDGFLHVIMPMFVK